MKNLDNYGVLEMDAIDINNIEGGFLWKRAWDVASKVATALEIGAAVDEFVAGWNSVE